MVKKFCYNRRGGKIEPMIHTRVTTVCPVYTEYLQRKLANRRVVLVKEKNELKIKTLSKWKRLLYRIFGRLIHARIISTKQVVHSLSREWIRVTNSSKAVKWGLVYGLKNLHLRINRHLAFNKKYGARKGKKLTDLIQTSYTHLRHSLGQTGYDDLSHSISAGRYTFHIDQLL